MGAATQRIHQSVENAVLECWEIEHDLFVFNVYSDLIYCYGY